MNRPFVVAILVLAPALAGCSGSGSNGSAELAGGLDGLSGTSSDARVMKANSSETEVITFSKTGATPDTTACVNNCNVVIYPLAPEMEPDTAYFLVANLTWQWQNNVQGAPWMALMGTATYRDYDGAESNFAEGVSTMTATLLPAGSNQQEIHIGGGVDAPDYVLEVTMTPIPDAIPQYAVGEVFVPAGGDLIIETQSGEGRVAIFDGSDNLFGIVAIDRPENTLPEIDVFRALAIDNASVDANYVILTLDDIWAKVFVAQARDEPAPTLRHLPFQINIIDHGQINSGGAISFLMDAERPPIQVGTSFGNNCVPEDCYVTSDAEFEFIDPDGQVIFSETFNCQLCGGTRGYFSNFDDGPFAAGTYTFNWNSEDTQRVNVETMWASYER